MRNLGRFFGEIGKAVRSDPISTDGPREVVEVRRETETETRETGRGTVTVRRTTIEEIELPSDRNA